MGYQEKFKFLIPLIFAIFTIKIKVLHSHKNFVDFLKILTLY